MMRYLVIFALAVLIFLLWRVVSANRRAEEREYKDPRPHREDHPERTHP